MGPRRLSRDLSANQVLDVFYPLVNDHLGSILRIMGSGERPAAIPGNYSRLIMRNCNTVRVQLIQSDILIAKEVNHRAATAPTTNCTCCLWHGTIMQTHTCLVLSCLLVWRQKSCLNRFIAFKMLDPNWDPISQQARSSRVGTATNSGGKRIRERRAGVLRINQSFPLFWSSADKWIVKTNTITVHPPAPTPT